MIKSPGDYNTRPPKRGVVPKLRARAVRMDPKLRARGVVPKLRARAVQKGPMKLLSVRCWWRAPRRPPTRIPRGSSPPVTKHHMAPQSSNNKQVSFCCINLGNSSNACLGGSYTYPRAGALPPGENETTGPAGCCQRNGTQHHSSGSNRFSYSNELA